MNLRDRQTVIGGIFLFIIAVFILRLFQLQVASNYWTEYAARLTEEQLSIDPARGMLYDRNGELLVTNVASYDVTITPRLARGKLDTLALAELLDMPLEELVPLLDKARQWSIYRPSVLVQQLPTDEFGKIAGELWRFPGVVGRTRSVRSNLEGLASHLIGEYGETTKEEMQADPWYFLGDFKGKSGLEAHYETLLRGRKGVQYLLVDVRNDIREPLKNGEYDSLAIAGANLTLTLDADLQRYAELLMQGKRGSVVAIEPATGEILCLVSAPTYDPDLLVGPRRGIQYDSLLKHPWKPLYNRALRGTYRPGSIFKMFQGLIALDEGVIGTSTQIYCNRDIISCHGSHTQDDLANAVVHSCNPYFHEVMRRMIQGRRSSSAFEDAALGLANWTDRMRLFGFGTDLGGHVPGASAGFLPDTAYYNKIYGKRRWAYSTIYSISIGEGELLTTPLQMANAAAAIANRGWYRTPHAVRDVGGQGKPEGAGRRVDTGIPPEQFAPIVAAMQAVVEQPGGTGWRAKTPGIPICGKTGTVQDEPRLEHSVFIAFAPMDNPKIALSVYVENAGAGGSWAAPIAALLIEQYLTDSISDPARELRVLEGTYPFE